MNPIEYIFRHADVFAGIYEKAEKLGKFIDEKIEEILSAEKFSMKLFEEKFEELLAKYSELAGREADEKTVEKLLSIMVGKTLDTIDLCDSKEEEIFESLEKALTGEEMKEVLDVSKKRGQDESTVGKTEQSQKEQGLRPVSAEEAKIMEASSSTGSKSNESPVFQSDCSQDKAYGPEVAIDPQRKFVETEKDGYKGWVLYPLGNCPKKEWNRYDLDLTVEHGYLTVDYEFHPKDEMAHISGHLRYALPLESNWIFVSAKEYGPEGYLQVYVPALVQEEPKKYQVPILMSEG